MQGCVLLYFSPRSECRKMFHQRPTWFRDLVGSQRPTWFRVLVGTLSWCRDHQGYAPSQWKMTLQCNVIPHWLGAFTKWSLMMHQTWNSKHSSTVLTNALLDTWTNTENCWVFMMPTLWSLMAPQIIITPTSSECMLPMRTKLTSGQLVVFSESGSYKFLSEYIAVLLWQV